mgnify:CR=1 FL=1
MQQIFIAILVTIFYISNFMCLGILFSGKMMIEDLFPNGRYLVVGFVCYFALFGIVTFPFKLALLPLSSLSVTWGIILIIFYMILFFKRRDKIFELIKKVKTLLKRLSVSYIIIFLLILIQILFVLTDRNEGLIVDSSYYVGQSSTNIYTNTIDQYSAYSGRKIGWLFSKNLFISYHVHRSMIGQIFGLSPLVEGNISMTIIVIIVSDILVLMFLSLFSKDIKKILIVYTLAQFAVMMNWGYPAVSKWYYWSTFNGKTSVFPFIIVPAYLILFIKLVQFPEEKKYWLFMLLTTLAGDTIATTATILSIVFLGVYGIVWLGLKRNIRTIPYMMMVVSPSIIIYGVHIINSKGYLLRYIP